MTDLFTLLGAAFAAVTLLTAVLWIVYYFQAKTSVLDIGWGIGFILIAWSYFFFSIGDKWKMLALALMVTIWGGRLTRHLWMRYLRNPGDDPRYEQMRKSWTASRQSTLVAGLFIFQGLLIMFLSLPFLLVAYGSHEGWSQWEVWGIIVWFLGVAGEAAADQQLTRFQKQKTSPTEVCRVGFWRFSRHPNYFFEILVWVGFFLFAYPSDGGLLAILAPITMAILLVKISGIPQAEAQSLRSKGDEYKEYQRTTSVLVPWFPKKDL